MNKNKQTHLIDMFGNIPGIEIQKIDTDRNGDKMLIIKNPHILILIRKNGDIIYPEKTIYGIRNMVKMIMKACKCTYTKIYSDKRKTKVITNICNGHTLKFIGVCTYSRHNSIEALVYSINCFLPKDLKAISNRKKGWLGENSIQIIRS